MMAVLQTDPLRLGINSPPLPWSPRPGTRAAASFRLLTPRLMLWVTGLHGQHSPATRKGEDTPEGSHHVPHIYDALIYTRVKTILRQHLWPETLELEYALQPC